MFWHMSVCLSTGRGYPGQVRLGRYPSQVQPGGGGTPAGMGYPWPCLTGVTWDGVPSSRDAVPPGQVWWGVTLGGDTPPAGVPPHPPVQDNRWSTWYAAVGMTPPFMKEDFLVFIVDLLRMANIQFKKWVSFSG